LARRKEAAPLTSISATPSERHPPADSSSRVIAAMRAARRQLEHRSLLSGDSPGARSTPASMERLLHSDARRSCPTLRPFYSRRLQVARAPSRAPPARSGTLPFGGFPLSSARRSTSMYRYTRFDRASLPSSRAHVPSDAQGFRATQSQSSPSIVGFGTLTSFRSCLAAINKNRFIGVDRDILETFGDGFCAIDCEW
jgi:hypothetical protein